MSFIAAHVRSDFAVEQRAATQLNRAAQTPVLAPRDGTGNSGPDGLEQ